MVTGNGGIEQFTSLETDLEEEDPSPSFQPSSSKDYVDQPPPADYLMFPRDIILYRTSYISLIIGPPYKANKPQPPPLFAISINMDRRFTNKSTVPQIRLHYGPNDDSPVIGQVQFRATTTSDIIIWTDWSSNAVLNPAQRVKSETKVELLKTGILTTNTHAYVLPPQDGRVASEKYEWRSSGSPEVKALATENLPGENISQQERGLKLVKVSTDETVAVFSGGVHSKTYNPKKVAGKLRFVKRKVRNHDY